MIALQRKSARSDNTAEEAVPKSDGMCFQAFLLSVRRMGKRGNEDDP